MKLAYFFVCLTSTDVSLIMCIAEIQKFQQIVSQFKEIIGNIATEVEKAKMKVSRLYT